MYTKLELLLRLGGFWIIICLTFFHVCMCERTLDRLIGAVVNVGRVGVAAGPPLVSLTRLRLVHLYLPHFPELAGLLRRFLGPGPCRKCRGSVGDGDGQ